MADSLETVVYSAIFGRKEFPWPAPNFQGVHFVLFTDDSRIRPPGWRVVVSPSEFVDPRKCAKVFKVLAHRYLRKYRFSLWVDGNLCPRVDPRTWMATVLKSGIATYRHHERDCIYDEAETCIRHGFNREVIERQMARYVDAGYPAHRGLHTCTIIAREHNLPTVAAAMEEWWAEIEGGSIRDQLSFDYVLWRRGLRPDVIPGHVYKSPLFDFTPHGTKPRSLQAFVEKYRESRNPFWRGFLAAKDALGRLRDRVRR